MSPAHLYMDTKFVLVERTSITVSHMVKNYYRPITFRFLQSKLSHYYRKICNFSTSMSNLVILSILVSSETVLPLFDSIKEKG